MDDSGSKAPTGAGTAGSQTNPGTPCPINHQIGRAIDTLTLKALLAGPLSQIDHPAYRFCSDPDCPTVYYSSDGEQMFTEASLRERVYQKHPRDDNVLVCYCFQHTVGSIRTEIEATGVSSVIARITAGIKAGQCACDIRNPMGDCCLGAVRRLVSELQSFTHE